MPKKLSTYRELLKALKSLSEDDLDKEIQIAVSEKSEIPESPIIYGPAMGNDFTVEKQSPEDEGENGEPSEELRDEVFKPEDVVIWVR